jgi:hypothetical protein
MSTNQATPAADASARPRVPKKPPAIHEIYNVSELKTPGLTQTVGRSDDSITVVRTRDGNVDGYLRFELGPAVDILARALDVAAEMRPEDAARNVGRFDLKTGATVEVGAATGRVLWRLNLPDGRRSQSSALIGSELAAARRAIFDLRAASARRLFERRTRGDNALPKE